MKKRIIYLTTFILILLLGIGVAYSYLMVRFSGLEEESTVVVGAGTMKIRYQNNSDVIVLEKEIPGVSVTKDFTITGLNDTKSSDGLDNKMYYKVWIVVDNNTFSENSLMYRVVSLNNDDSNEYIDTNEGYIPSEGRISIGTGYFESSTEEVSHKYRVILSFPETGMDQSVDMGAEVGLHLTVTEGYTGVEYVSDLYETDDGKDYLMYDNLSMEPESGVSTVSNISNLNKVKFLDSTVTGDGNLRYYGDVDNNYLEFGNEGELWRIIGVFNVVEYTEDGKEEVKKAIKIVRNESLGKYAWNVTMKNGYSGYAINQWGEDLDNDYYGADLMRELNGDYLNYNLTENTNWKIENGVQEFDYTKTIKEKYQQYIMNAKWYLSGDKNYSYSVSAENIYNAERSSVQYDNKLPSYWYGKVGLMYASDYGYASSDQTCINNIYLCNNDKSKNWLYSLIKDKKESYWLLSVDVKHYALSFAVTSTGSCYADSTYFSRYSENVHPSLYLKSDVNFSSGDGTIDNPYKIK